MSDLTLDQLATHLDKDLVSTVRYIAQNKISFTTIDSTPYFDLNKLPVPPVKLTKVKNKFVLDYIESGRRKQARDGILNKSSGLVDAFQKKFGQPSGPYIYRMREAKLVNTYPMEGEQMIVEPGPKGLILDKTTSLDILCEEEREQINSDSDNYRYPNKASWRQEFINFCKDNLQLGPNSTALCLGGYGDEIQIYEQLGVLPKNIYVMEMDRSKALFIHDKYPKVNVYLGDAVEFLKQNKQEFDIIMIDDDGPLKEGSLDMSIQSVRRLKDDAIFGLNVLGRRESNVMKDTYMEMFVFPDGTSSVSRSGFRDAIPDEILDGKTYIPLRSRGISAFIMRCLLEPNTHSINRKIVEALPKKTVQQINEELHNSSPDTIMGYIKTNFSLVDQVNSLLVAGGLPSDLGMARALYTSNLHQIQKHARLIYQTALGNNDYYSDFMKVTRPTRSQQREQISEAIGSKYHPFKKFIYGVGKAESVVRTFDKHLSPSDKRDLCCRIVNLGSKLRSAHKGLFIKDQLQPRKLVKGSDYALPDEVKYDVVAMIHFGLENNDIIKQFPGLERRIGAIRMNYNNGTYQTIIEELIKK